MAATRHFKQVHNNKKVQNIFAPYEVWTHDPQFTRLVLYHWAKGASCELEATVFAIIFFYYQSCALSKQPKENTNYQGLVNFSQISGKGKALIMIVPADLPRALQLLQFGNTVRLAEWSKAWDLSSHNRKIAWVRTPHLTKLFCRFNFFPWYSGCDRRENTCLFWISLVMYFGRKL